MKNKRFTPLEKTAEKISIEIPFKAEGGLKQPSAYAARPVRKFFSNRGKELCSLTGFTLIELMLVVIIIGTLAALVIPRLAGRAEQARNTAVKADILSNIPLALDLYELDNGVYPTSQQGLDALIEKTTTQPIARNWNGPYLKKKPVDPWGNEYRYLGPGIHNTEDYDLFSLGKDGSEGGNDDIGNWED